MNNSKTVGIYTLGCRVNMYESCALSERLKEKGFEVLNTGTCDYYIINTCAVTSESERKSRQLIRRCAAKGKVLVIGCASQLNDDYINIPNVIYNGGNRNKMSVVDVLTNGINSNESCLETMKDAPYEFMYLNGTDELFSECRAFIKIQDGCNGKCTYCIIPTCRGSVRSREADEVISEAERLSKNGYQEIILTGIEVGAYNKIPLYELIKRVSLVEGVKRIRLGSLSPNIINDKFLQEVSSIKSFMPHFHLSLQSCNDRILRLMKRPYNKADIFDRVEKIKRYFPDAMISADIIVGFPTETEEDFVEIMNAVSELGLYHVHSFPYSERKGTPAAEMQNEVPKHVRAERNIRLSKQCIDSRKAIFSEMKGKVLSVLIEKIVDGTATGHSEEFIETSFPADNKLVGNIVNVEIQSYDENKLFGIII